MDITVEQLQSFINLSSTVNDKHLQVFLTEMFILHPHDFVASYDKVYYDETYQTIANFRFNVNDLAIAKDYWDGGKKVDAIKCIRSVTGWDIVEAKRFCENYL